MATMARKIVEQGGNVLEEFKEFEEIRNLISNLTKIFNDPIEVERATERFLFVIDQYQEQPHLLDPHLESLLTQLLDIAKNKNSPDAVVHLAFKLLYLITKTRGYKVIIRLMPHEVADLEPVLTMIDQQDPTNFLTWETRYMLLLWLSTVSMIPFDMSRLDSTARAQGIQGKKPTMDRILDIGKIYLNVSDKSRDAASYMMSRFMTRVDVKDKKMAEFLDYALVVLSKADYKTLQGTTSLLGVMRTLCLLFKYGKREDLVNHATTTLNLVTNATLNLKGCIHSSVRKLAIKLIQRLGLTFLKARVAAWRYQRGNRSLADNLSSDQSAIQSTGVVTDEDDEYDIPEELEDVIENLLTGLKDKDTVVRWSAAKGIGRVLGRLPKELADEVVGSIMEMFTIMESDGAWHGGCLALAELGRRGLLLPQRIPDIVPVIIKALNYDQKRGNFSVGAHVRDAACYVCWAFARAYDPEEIKPHVHQIASALVIVSLFDREVNVRRAASAAFQENVGRQGQFPHGIDILTTCDYFAVGNRTTCYLTLSVFVGQFPEYTRALIDHLLHIKVNHWDKSVRELTAEALYNLTVKDPEYMSKTVVPELITMATSMELSLRHGAILAAVHITHALAKLAHFKKGAMEEQLGKVSMSGLEGITYKLQDAKLFRGLGGELMREAVCCLIKKLSLSNADFKDAPIIGVWQDFLDDCLQHNEPDIQAPAVDAIPAFFTAYYQDGGKPDLKAQNEIISKYVSQLSNPTESIRQGYALALGALPKLMVQGQFDRVLSGLIQASTITDKDKKLAESRRDAIKAITSLCLTVSVNKSGKPSNCVCAANITMIYDALFAAMKDYTLDSRGDVGAWVREASMSGLHDISSMLVTTDASLLSDNISRTMFCSLIQQACEKIDRTRAHAGEIFYKLLYHKSVIPHIPHRDKLLDIFCLSDGKIPNCSGTSTTFPKFTKLLDLEHYTYHVLLGLTVSVGGLTESLVKFSATSLLEYLQTILDDRPKLETFTSTLIKIFKDHQKVDRVTLPMFKMLDQLQCNGCFNKLAEESHPFGVELLSVCRQEVAKSGEPQKLLASIDVFCGLLQFTGDVQKKVLFQMMVYLCHRFPIIRKTTANKLYEAMLTFDDLVEDENLDQVLTILSETQWDQPIDQVKPLRNKLCDLYNINQPVSKTATKMCQGDGESKKIT